MRISDPPLPPVMNKNPENFLPNREWALHPFLADDLEVLILIPATAHLTCRSTSSVIHTARHNLFVTDKDDKG